MRGRREDTVSLRQRGYRILEQMYLNGKGTSKHADKLANGGKPDPDKIYTDNTKHQYDRFWGYFCDAIKADGYKYNGHSPRTPQEAVGFLPRYVEILKERPGSKPGTTMSAASIHNYVAAACKVLHVNMDSLTLPGRHVTDITRSREPAIRDKNFSEKNNAELKSFCLSVGLRSKKELQQLKGSQLVKMPEGSRWTWGVSLIGKGGRHRIAPVIGTDAEINAVVTRMKAAGHGLVWERVHNAADVHNWRAAYAARIYNSVARDPKTLKGSERYCCRGDGRRGTWYDRAALMVVSEALGHSRANVAAENYDYLFNMWSSSGIDFK